MSAQAHSDARLYLDCRSSPCLMKSLRAEERCLASLLLLMQIGWLSLGTCAKMRVVQRVFSAAEWCMEMAFRDARRAWIWACARRVEAARRAMAAEEVWPMPPGCPMAPTRANSRWAWSNWEGPADPQAPPVAPPMAPPGGDGTPPGGDETPMAPPGGDETPAPRASSPMPPGYPPPCPPLEPVPPPEDRAYDWRIDGPGNGRGRIIHEGVAANFMGGGWF